MVAFDARATSVPLWLAASGFVLWEGVEVAGAEYKTPYTYKVCRGVGENHGNISMYICACGSRRVSAYSRVIIVVNVESEKAKRPRWKNPDRLSFYPCQTSSSSISCSA